MIPMVRTIQNRHIRRARKQDGVCRGRGGGGEIGRREVEAVGVMRMF